MAKFEGTQSVPAEWLDLYRATLTEGMSTRAVRKRFPFRLRLFQKNGYKVKAKQLEQRSRFEAIRNKFKTVSWATRQRWYAARPPWGSLLWYYNYFMLSGLMGNAVVGNEGGGVIKSIQHKTFALPTSINQDRTVTITAVDPAKAICFFYGAGAAIYPADTMWVAIPVYPYLHSLMSSSLLVRVPTGLTEAANGSVSVIEYI
jgi:hypothetical protein